MGLFDIFKQKRDPEIEAAERRSYEKEREFVRQEKKTQAIKEASERGRRKAREGSGVAAAAKKVASKIKSAGEYGASLNWGDSGSMQSPFQQEQPRARSRSKKSSRKGRSSRRSSEGGMFDLPEFPF